MAKDNPRPSAAKSNRAKREARSRQEKPVLVLLSIVLIVLLCAVALILFSMIADRSSQTSDKQGETGTSETGTDKSPSESQTSQSGSQTTTYDVVPMEQSKDKQGPLVLINSTHEIDPAAATDLVNMYANMPKTDDGKMMYKMLNAELRLNRTALDAFHRMIKDFYAEKNDTRLLVTGAYRTAEEQKKSSTPVGQSDHHSGYLVSLKYLAQNGTNTGLSEDNKAWFANNAYKYGFVIRYPEGKESVTGLSDYYALRYVGYAHAYYMHENNLCMEEYLELLNKKYSDNSGTGNHLHFTADDGNVYDIYYVPAASELTSVPIPKDVKYELSGTNTNGFVITVTRN